MSFLQPLGLLGLLSLPAIVILHLLRERHRREPISSLELWAWLEREVRGPRPRRLPLTWVLFLQLLAALFLSLALARPQLPLPLVSGGTQRIILLVDTSSSMSATDTLPSRLGEAQARAGALLAGLAGDDSAVLISVGPQAERLGDSSQSGIGPIARALAGLRPAGVGNDWAGALALAAASSLPGQVNRVVVFTDGAFEFPAELAGVSLPGRVEWNLVGGATANQAVAAVAARVTPSGAVQVFARIANFSDAASRRLVTLLADGATIDSSQALVDASGTVAYTWTLPPGIRTVQVQLSGDDPLPADDSASLGVSGGQTSDVLLVAADPEVLQRALGALPNLRVTRLSPDAYTSIEPHDLTVFAGWLPPQWPAGGVLVVDPPLNSPLLPSAGSVQVDQFPATALDPLFADVSLDHVVFGRAAVLQPESWLIPVLADDNGLGLAWRGVTGSTRVVALAFNLNETNIIRRAAFPVLIANAVSELLPPPLPASIRPGEAVSLPSAHVFASLSLTDPQGNKQILGPDRPEPFSDTAEPGLYLVDAAAPDGSVWQTGFGVNAGSLVESDLRLQAAPVFTGTLAGDGAFVPEREPLAELWPFLLALALIALLVEASLAWI